MTKECPSDKGAVRLPSGMKMDACKGPEDSYFQCRNVNLRQMYIDFTTAMRPRHLSPVDDRQVHSDGDGRVDTAFLRARIDQGMIVVARQIGNCTWIGGWIETDSHRQCRAETNENFRPVDKPAISFRHCPAPCDGEPTPEAPAAARQSPVSGKGLDRNAEQHPKRPCRRTRKLPPDPRRGKQPTCRNGRFPIRGACRHRLKCLCSNWTWPPRATVAARRISGVPRTFAIPTGMSIPGRRSTAALTHFAQHP